MKARSLFIVTAVVEATTGLALISIPSVTAEILLGSALSSPTSTIVARVAGAALIAIAVSCWMSRDDRGSLAAKALISGMLLYNIVAAVILVYAAFVLPLSIVLLLTILVHLGLAAWCLFVLQYVRRNKRI